MEGLTPAVEKSSCNDTQSTELFLFSGIISRDTNGGHRTILVAGAVSGRAM
jgi:hypothetical protein